MRICASCYKQAVNGDYCARCFFIRKYHENPEYVQHILLYPDKDGKRRHIGFVAIPFRDLLNALNAVDGPSLNSSESHKPSIAGEPENAKPSLITCVSEDSNPSLHSRFVSDRRDKPGRHAPKPGLSFQKRYF